MVKLEGFFSSLKNFVKIEDFKKIKKIFFSTGPGSFTATRSIKAISQGLSLYSGAELFSTSTFSLFLSKLDYKSENVLVCLGFVWVRLVCLGVIQGSFSVFRVCLGFFRFFFCL